MKKQKRVQSLALALVMALTLLPTAALAAEVTQVVPYRYKEVHDFHEGFAAVRSENGWGFIDKTGNEVVPCQYQNVLDFEQGFARVKQAHKWGIVDAAGKEIVPCQYSEMKGFHEGLAAVELGVDKWGYIDQSGKEVIPGPLKYNDVGDFCCGLATVRLEQKWGVIDQTGREIVSADTYDYISNYAEGLAAVRVGPDYDGKWGFIDTTGKEVIPCEYLDEPVFHTPPVFSQGLSAVRGDSGVRSNGQTVYKWGFIDKTGKVVVPFRYDFAKPFDQGLAAVNMGADVLGSGGRWGFININGEEVTPCQYREVGDFHDGLVAVRADSHVIKYGFVDATGAETIPCEYGSNAGLFEMPKFSCGLANVEIRTPVKNAVFIDATGQKVFEYSGHAEDFSENLAAISDSNGWGYIDITGKEVIPTQYGEARQLSEGMLAVAMDRKWGFLSVTGLPSGSQPVPDDIPALPRNVAYASTQTVNVDGKAVTFECYALKDTNGNATNYIKLRDLAMLLGGTEAQFQVGWDGAVTITTKTAYTPNGSELSTPYSGDRAYQETSAATKVNGQTVDLGAFMLTDDQGGGYTYYQLRDLGKALGFNVGWSAEKGMFIETDKPYDANN